MHPHPPTGDDPIYLIKFVNECDVPGLDGRPPRGLRLGTLHSFREMENTTIRDTDEGQRGLDLLVRRPSPALEELAALNSQSLPRRPRLSEDGSFEYELHLLNPDHLGEFNAWAFCCSATDDLDDIPRLADVFGGSAYYFITKVDEFANELQRSLAADLKANPLTPQGQRRIQYPDDDPVLIDGWKDFVTYNDDARTLRLEVNTYEEFVNEHRRTVDQRIWLTKRRKFGLEREFRFLLFATAGRDSNVRYSTSDDTVTLNDVNLSGCTSRRPEPSDLKRI